AFLGCFVLILLWFVHSVPYRLPGIRCGRLGADLNILHIEKRGVQFHETVLSILKDGRFFKRQTNRHLFQFRFTSVSSSGAMSPSATSRAMAFAHSLRLNPVATPRAESLKKWNGEGWYIEVSESVIAFSSEYHSDPPLEIKELFEEVEALPVTDYYPPRTTKDVCLGFCFDPTAALGLVQATDRCRTYESGIFRCQ